MPGRAVRPSSPIRDAVRWNDRGEHLDTAVGCDDVGDAAQHGPVQAQHAPEQRAPRERDRHERDDAGQRSGQRLGGPGEEQGVRQPSRRSGAVGSTGCLGHRRRVRIDADHQGVRLRVGARKHGSAVAGPEIDDHPIDSGDPLVELADVHLGDAPADDLSHGRQSSECPGSTGKRWSPVAPRFAIMSRCPLNLRR
jgi:hypothetical protein